jgi:hypothetical protein
MRRLSVVAFCLLAIGALGVPAALADPDPDTNKNAVIVTFTCGGDAVDVVTILQNAALAVQRVDGRGVLVLVKITLVDQSTGEVIFAFEVPGFDHNSQETTTCTATNPLFPNALQTMEVFFRPA